MAKLKKQRRPQKTLPAKPAEPIGFVWNCIAVIATASAVALFVCAAFPDWRVTDTTIIHWYDATKLNNQLFNPTKFGLYSISFNGGVSSVPWYRKTSYICAGIDAYAPLNQAIGIFVSSPCPASCIRHYRSRCAIYRSATTVGYALLGSCIITGMLAILGAGWLVIFGKSSILLQVLWLGSGIANLCFFGWWVFETDSGFSKLILQSQYPYPSIGPAAIGALAFTLIICSLGIFVTLAGCIEDAVFWQKRKLQIDDAIITDQHPSGPLSPGSTFVTPFSPVRTRPQDQYKGPSSSIGHSMGLSSPGFGPPHPPGFTPPPQRLSPPVQHHSPLLPENSRPGWGRVPPQGSRRSIL